MAYQRNFEKEYQDSKESATMNMTEYGALLVGRYSIMVRRGLILKKEYRDLLKLIEKQLFRI